LNHLTKGCLKMKSSKFFLICMLVISILCGQSVFAVTDYIFFTVNGDTLLPALVQGDELSWSANCGVGSNISWEIWYDANTNSIIDTATDVHLETFIVTDGDTVSTDGPGGDNNPVPDGWFHSPAILLGLAPGTYIFSAKDLGDNSTVTRTLANSTMSSPPNTFSGQITVPGHPAPDNILQNVWIDAEADTGDAGFYIALTNNNGNYSINVGDIGTGLTFRIEPSNINGFVTPGEQMAVAAGVVSNLDFVYEIPTDSVYGNIKDDADALITNNVSVEASKGSGSSYREDNTTDGSYALFFSAADVGEWYLNVNSDNLIPDYLVPDGISFNFLTTASFRHDFISPRADTQLYVKVIENGGLPASNYRISARSQSLNAWTSSVSLTGSDNVTTMHISSLDNSGWEVDIDNWDENYPIPAGLVVEGIIPSDLSPGDTATMNLINGLMVSDVVVQDPDDDPIGWGDVWIFMWSNTQNFGTYVGAGGAFTLYGTTNFYSMTANADGYLTDPSVRGFDLSADTTGGLGFTINKTHCRVTGVLENIPVPLNTSGHYIYARTGAGADGYRTGAYVDSVTGTYDLWLCDGDWLIQPPSVIGYTTPDSISLTNGEVPDTLRVVDFDYTPLSSCCVGLTGNVDDDPSDIIDIGDLTALIDYLFITFAVPECMEEANCDGSINGIVDIGDLTALIDYLFISFTPPALCQ